MIIGLSSRKRCGKDTLTKIFIRKFAEHGIFSKRYAFADELKRELDPLFLLNSGESAFTEDPVEKELMRGVFIEYGTGYWRNKDPDHWIKKVAAQIKKEEKPHVSIISDARFAANEIPWIQNQGGKVIYLARIKDDGTEFPPAGKDEEENDAPLRNLADFCLSWEDFHDNLDNLAIIGEKWFYEIFGDQLDELRAKFPL